jgi:hypothetical protein
MRALARKNLAFIRRRSPTHDCKFVASHISPALSAPARLASRITFASPSRARSAARSATSTIPVCRLHHREMHDYGDEAHAGPAPTLTRCRLLSSCGGALAQKCDETLMSSFSRLLVDSVIGRLQTALEPSSARGQGLSSTKPMAGWRFAPTRSPSRSAGWVRIAPFPAPNASPGWPSSA